MLFRSFLLLPEILKVQDHTRQLLLSSYYAASDLSLIHISYSELHNMLLLVRLMLQLNRVPFCFCLLYTSDQLPWSLIGTIKNRNLRQWCFLCTSLCFTTSRSSALSLDILVRIKRRSISSFFSPGPLVP